jgi:hypothetical protein
MAAVSSLRINGVAADLKKTGMRLSTVSDLTDNPEDLRRVTLRLYQAFPRIFQPINVSVIHRHISQIVSTLRFKPAGVAGKAVLSIIYIGILLVSMILAAFFGVMDYHERISLVDRGGMQVRVVQRFSFGQRRSETPVDENFLLDGQGLGFESDTSRASNIYHYRAGFRTGMWVTLDSSGDTTEREYYTQGRLDSVSTKEDSVWVSRPFKQLPFLRRLGSTISLHAQPFRSLHLHFEEK